MERRDKLAKLVAVFDQFHDAIADLEDPQAKSLVQNWVGIREQYVMPTVAPRSAFAAGMEQGLRETPMLLRSMQPDTRKSAALALAAAISENYPDFLEKDTERIAKVKTRGSIRGESEFYLIRHHVDVLEGAPGNEEELRKLNVLLDGFESRRK